MACFVVPLFLGILTTLLSKKFPKEWHVGWLNAMLWGGSLMLMVEHVAHGEIVPYPPFLTGGNVFGEMLHIGVPMALASVFVWVGIVKINASIIKRAESGLRTKTGILR
ncbi:MAG: hypothetical protein QXX33_03300 [Candidatus Hadarchaeales archaeon]